jgi:hypothetical protein
MAKRITEFTSATSLAETDVLPIVDVSDTTQATSGTTKKSALSLIADYIKTRVETLTNKTLSSGSVIDANVTVVEVLKKVYPVGSLYINASDATNPATLLGFGTWEAFGQGRVMVGKETSGTFATVGATGGAETVTLDLTMIPAHNHNISVLDGATDDYLAGSSEAYGMDENFNSAHTQRELTETVGGGLAHNNLQPYIVVYMWKRAS